MPGTFGRMGSGFGRMGAVGGGGGTPPDPHPGNDVLLRDASSKLLLRDGSSTLQLGH